MVELVRRGKAPLELLYCEVKLVQAFLEACRQGHVWLAPLEAEQGG